MTAVHEGKVHARSIVHTSTKTKSFSGRAFFYQKIFCICCSCVGVGWSNQLPFLREIHAVCLYCFAQKDTQHSTKHFFSDVYLFCLHKDPNDATKLRPLGIPTAMRRIIARHVAQHFKPKFAEYLLHLITLPLESHKEASPSQRHPIRN